MVSSEIREAWRSFTTGVAFITSRGSRGPNVMSAEWTFNVSYEPFLISVHLDPESATAEAIDETKEFGVNIVAEDQVAAMGFAGHFSRKETDKTTSGRFEFFDARRIGAPLVRGALLNAECRLVNRVEMGDHVAFVGEVVDFEVDQTKKPVVLHRGSRHLGERIVRKEEIVVAATLREKGMVVDGELAGPDRSRRGIRVEVLGPDGSKFAEGSAVTDERGFFELEFSAPGAGEYRVDARSDFAAGSCRLKLPPARP